MVAMSNPADGAESGRRASAAPERATGARKRAAPKAAATVTKARRRTPTANATAAAGEPTADDGAWPGPPWARGQFGRRRSGALYNRRLQRMSEHWALPTRIGAALFARPERLLALVGSPPPVERGGRVLHRGVQVAVELAARFEGRAGTSAEQLASVSPAQMRAQLDQMAQLAMPSRTDVHVTGRMLTGHDGTPSLPARVYRQFGVGLGPSVRPPAIVYYHGGGWVTGSLASHDASCRLLAAVTGCVIVSIDYRLAPEDPFPAAVDDALAAYQWVQEHADGLGVEPGQVGVMGDSAGGNLAAVVALEARDGLVSGRSAVPAPIAQGLVYPATDMHLATDSARDLGEGFFLSTAQMDWFRAKYVPDRAQWDDPRASPLLASDHRGLAPALVATAGFDPLRDDGALYAAALRAAGVEVEERCYDDQVHGFFGMGFIPDSLAIATEVCDAMGRLMRRAVAAARNG
jgi:acetyl esterase/lipase